MIPAKMKQRENDNKKEHNWKQNNALIHYKI